MTPADASTPLDTMHSNVTNCIQTCVRVVSRVVGNRDNKETHVFFFTLSVHLDTKAVLVFMSFVLWADVTTVIFKNN